VDLDAIAERIRRHFEDTHPATGLTLDDELSQSVLVDSLSIVTTVAFLEDEFSIRVRRADLNGRTFRSIRTLSEYVAGQTRG
jgi:acyl carrier protein